MKSRVLIAILLVFHCLLLHAETIRVGMFYGANHVRATLLVKTGSYEVFADDISILTLGAEEFADITESSGEIHIFFEGKNYTGYKKLRLITRNQGQFKMTPLGTKPSARVYEENLIAFSYNGHLQLVNEVAIENYVSGVIEAESGKGQELEYYKVQAVISRTYALNNLTRHQSEGYQICDATHCQVFHGTPRVETKARIATDATKDIVIVDHDINLITAAFHSNCGGHTLNAEAVWSKPVTYLIGRPDSFCLGMPHSNWEKTIPKKRWEEYLENKRHPLSDDTLPSDYAFYPSEKIKYFTDSTLKIPMKTMREDFKLRSAFFTVQSVGDSISFIGQGFGHAVGLCQEGAMNMATNGRKYEDIVHFYYTDVHLIPRYMMWFYRE